MSMASIRGLQCDDLGKSPAAVQSERWYIITEWNGILVSCGEIIHFRVILIHGYIAFSEGMICEL
jgi:hypothetical protein